MDSSLPIYSIVTDSAQRPFVLCIYARHIAPSGLQLLPSSHIAFIGRNGQPGKEAQIEAALYRILNTITQIPMISLNQDGEYLGECILPIHPVPATDSP